MKTIDWMYHRKNCTTCQKSDNFFAVNKVQVKNVVDCKKEIMHFDDALKLLAGVDKLYATKGVKVFEVDMKTEKPTKARLEELLIGPSGKLRAPTIKNGKTLVVGFNEGMYKSALFD
ncbi:MAG TPA: ArsC family (seleno)protein [Oculatellaceae cyanobacterium]